MTPIAKWLLAVAMHLLPRQSHRRYEDEFDAELLALGAPRLRPLSPGRHPRLRWSLLATLSGGHASLRCWLVKHHDRIVHPNTDDHLIIALECVRCGRVRDPRQYLPRQHRLDGVAGAGPSSPADADNATVRRPHRCRQITAAVIEVGD